MNEAAFVSGWNPDRAIVARGEMLASKRYCTVNAPVSANLPAISLSQFSLRVLEQGQAGTCWLHAGVDLAETLAVARKYKTFPICRRLVGWQGKQLEGGGNPTNGGTPTDALAAMTADKGVGIAHEDLLAYTDDSRALGSKPPQNVFDDAKKSHLLMLVDVTSNDQIKTLLNANMPTAIGTWWPYNFDQGQTFMTSIGRGTYGHALTIIGYAEAGVIHEKAVWQWRNWHGQLYPPLSAELAAKVPGYKPDNPTTTSDFWVTDDCQRSLQARNGFEMISATDLDGLASNIVVPSFSDAFPV